MRLSGIFLPHALKGKTRKMANPNTTPEAVPASIQVDTAVTPATTTAKAVPPGGEHKSTNVEPPKS
jgi:hypothetical protein